ncbi:CRISPR-associated protein Cas1-1 [Methanobrevibacter ruminantium M1]|uniref:CRISPR-associated protein Cas1 1 n=1 Tax=Methanobrevibacter ruminantium (strain ATCC 35063 / DSM 1093 / JCM 13430 / OCM 146 / M1) TaxID=634498 RepID=CAS1A_METRM|nr:type I-B CRISPR-associated endonuclease Cas1b [Methanobrevibacter ruminantium]D3E288.1 RecName: Full=CRISPR-associated protein Cas1 1 [Methanobrevibacter ruminantium M1]ADC46649.1 CRISPR-associated protein Cas1-1 [Methanobrevibacter ruminantium M1]
MSKKNYYLLSEGILKRKENTIYFVNEKGSKPLPINKIYSMYAYGQITISSQVISLFAKEGIPIHFFNYYGYYNGSFYPRESLLSGDLLIKQAEHNIDFSKRLKLAKLFVEGAAKNILKVLAYYKIENNIKNTLTELNESSKITEVMNVEGRIRAEYYQYFDDILPDEFKMEGRSRQPPTNMINSLISFGNSMMYASVITELYNTQLNPTISYLHEPAERRFSLALDLSEIFKPIIVDRVIFYLVNKKMITEKDFNQDLNCCLLNDKGRATFVKEYNKRLETTIKHKDLGRKVSYQRLIRLEAYKLKKHVFGMKEYDPFVIWW